VPRAAAGALFVDHRDRGHGADGVRFCDPDADTDHRHHPAAGRHRFDGHHCHGIAVAFHLAETTSLSSRHSSAIHSRRPHLRSRHSSPSENSRIAEPLSRRAVPPRRAARTSARSSEKQTTVQRGGGRCRRLSRGFPGPTPKSAWGEGEEEAARGSPCQLRSHSVVVPECLFRRPQPAHPGRGWAHRRIRRPLGLTDAVRVRDVGDVVARSCHCEGKELKSPRFRPRLGRMHVANAHLLLGHSALRDIAQNA
jgi:hypothetical protein